MELSFGEFRTGEGRRGRREGMKDRGSKERNNDDNCSNNHKWGVKLNVNR